jgi:protein SCO1
MAATLLAVVPVAGADEPTAAQLMDDVMWGRGPIGGPFALIDQTGRLRTDADFSGKLMLIYFGYTFCPDVCPTDLMAISQAVELLGEAGDGVQPIFISVDPERDTVAHLAEYVTSFHRRLIALTGTPADIRKIARAYKAWYAKVESPRGEDYAIDHTGFIYLVGRDGKYLGFFPPGTTPERMVEIIRRHLP